MGLCFNIVFIFSFEKVYPKECEINCLAKIESYKEEKNNLNKYIIKVIKNEENKKSVGTKLIIYVDKKNELIPGDIVQIKGDFTKADEARNYGGFNYRRYLKQSKIYGVVFCKNIKKTGENIGVLEYIKILRYTVSKRIYELYDKNQADFLNGILIGDTVNIDENIKGYFTKSNISHILAISGLHVSYVILGASYLLDKFNINKNIKNCILIIFLIFFSVFTGMAVSCIRACLMNIFILLSFNYKRKNNFWVSCFYSFGIIIIINPYNIFNIGMWLSYMGTLGIVFFNKFIYLFVDHYFRNNKLVKDILSIIIVSFAAQIMILPIIIYEFNIISLTFIIPNFLISFLIIPVLILGYSSIFISYFLPIISKVVVLVEESIISLILNIAQYCSLIPFSKIYIITPYFIVIIFYYFCMYKLQKSKFTLLRLMIDKKRKKKLFEKKKKLLIIVLILILLINSIKFNKNLIIYFVDVGQGDCFLIITPKGKNIIIDGGEENDVVLSYLLDRRIKKIDYWIISHFDSDHCGEFLHILNEINVKKVIIGKQFEINNNLITFMNIANKRKIKVLEVTEGKKINIEDNLYFDILWPEEKECVTQNLINNNALVCKLNYIQFSILFTGDIEKIAEEKILKNIDNDLLNADILKVAHHGSKTSSIEEFIEAVKPKIALIGVGKNNKFGHPNDDVINRLNKLRRKNL